MNLSDKESIRNLQKGTRELCDANGWSDDPNRRMIFLVTEIGELAKEFLALTDENLPESKRKEIEDKLGIEAADAVWNIMNLCEIFNIDLGESMHKKYLINKVRTWK